MDFVDAPPLDLPACLFIFIFSLLDRLRCFFLVTWDGLGLVSMISCVRVSGHLALDSFLFMKSSSDTSGIMAQCVLKIMNTILHSV